MPMNRRQIGTTAIRQSNIEGAERNVRFRPIADAAPTSTATGGIERRTVSFGHNDSVRRTVIGFFPEAHFCPMLAWAQSLGV